MIKNRQLISFLIGILALSFGCKKTGSKDIGQMSIPGLQEAAAQGNDEAMVRLGLLYDVGWGGVAKNTNEAIKWYRQAAEDKNPDGEFHLAYCYFVGRDANQDFPEAIKWTRLAVNAGQPDAEILLGIAYNKGFGVEKSDEEAFNWYQKSAQQGSWRGQYILGDCLLKGNGTETNTSEAFTWFKKAAESGYGKAQANLEICILMELELNKTRRRLLVGFEKLLIKVTLLVK